MSEYIADVVCPECSGMVWVLQRWRTRTVVSCAACHHEYGELAVRVSVQYGFTSGRE